VRNFLVRRIIQSLVLLWVLMTCTFFLVRLTPGGPEAALADQPNITAADVERLRERFGLNDPLPVAYAKWVGNAVRLDFGRSYQYLRPPLDVIAERFGPTAQLAGISLAFGLLGVPLGLWAAVKRGKLPDSIIRIATVIGDAVPIFWMGLVVIVVMASLLGWFPSGMGRGGPDEWFKYIIVPGLILGLGPLVKFTRFTRSQVLEVIDQDYVRTGRAKGLPERRVLGAHVLRNALIPSITVLGAVIPTLLSGAIITEGVFSWPGLGRLYLESAVTRDYPLLLALVTIFTGLTLIFSVLADIAYGVADPRVRYS
jgi:peptide/nickel transport system permease protein